MAISQDLILRIKKGDEKAFELLVDNYYYRLYRFVGGYIDQEEDCKEIVQESFVKIWLNRKELESWRNLEGFLFTIARNLCLDYLKHLKIVNQHNKYIMSELYKKSNFRSLSDDSLRELIIKETRGEIDKAINSLPEQCKRIFKMHRFEEKKYHEIAEELGISVKTVDNQISKALKILREKLRSHL
jgi:RNA polymerase sigma-70 factor (ECF subfamily)